MLNTPRDFHWNLYPWRQIEQQRQRRILLNQFLKTVLLAMLSVVFLHGLLFFSFMFENARYHKFSIKLSYLQSTHAMVNSTLSTFKQLPLNNDILQALLLLPTYMPDSIYLTQLTMKNRQLTLLGHAQTTNQIAILLKQIQHGAHFFHAIMTEMTPIADDPHYHYQFTLQTAWRGER